MPDRHWSGTLVEHPWPFGLLTSQKWSWIPLSMQLFPSGQPCKHLKESTHDDCSEHTQRGGPSLSTRSIVLHELDAQSPFVLHKSLVFRFCIHLLSNPIVVQILLAHSQSSSQTAPTGLPTHLLPEQMVDTQSAPVVQGDPLSAPARHTICQQWVYFQL